MEAVLISFLNRNGVEALLRFKELEKTCFKEPMMVRMAGDESVTPAFIDKSSSFNESDKLSQVWSSYYNPITNCYCYPLTTGHFLAGLFLQNFKTQGKICKILHIVELLLKANLMNFNKSSTKRG